ncbi:MAG: hypothetical protein ACTTKO_00890 [Candidatus Limimorpha sp.]
MKKVLITLIAVFAISLGVQAQSNLGLRFGNGSELSWQYNLSDANRLEFNLGLNGIFNNGNWHYFCLTGAYQWHWDIVDKLGWYVGPAAQVGFYSWKNHNSEIAAAVGGQIGLDYVLPIPLQLSLDVRPMWFITDRHDYGYDNGFGYSAGLGIRYMF